jgi:hypothetical protein
MFVGYRPWIESLAKHLGGDKNACRRTQMLCGKENVPNVSVR